MGYIVQGKEYTNALLNCSPKIQLFLKRLAVGDPLVHWGTLIANGYGEEPFTVVESLRSMTAQVDFYKKGRTCDIKKEYARIGADYPLRGTRYILESSVVTDSSKVVTKAFGGKSYHNYGLAVDIYPTLTKWKTTVEWGQTSVKQKIDVKEWFKRSGIVDLARDCGLEWGGSWSEIYDPWHFQDSSYKIPDGYDYNFDDNCNFQFISDFNAGKFDKFSSENKSGFSFAGFISSKLWIPLTVASYLIYAFLNRSKK